MIIRNRDELATTGLRSRVLDIVEAGITRVLPEAIIRAAVGYDPARRILTVQKDEYDLSRGRVFVVGGGKASALMAQALENILSPANITAGVVNVKHHDGRTGKIKIIEAGHPVPDGRGLEGVSRMLALKDLYGIGEHDLVVCLLSGGGSALMPCPVEGVSLADKQRITQLLLGSGAAIDEINAVRKHLSRTKGGGLGRYFAPATVLSLILSDVIGSDLGVIASGPTYPDASTFAEAYGVLEKYGLLEKAPRSIVEYFKAGCEGKTAETPKKLADCRSYLLGDSSLALEAMYRKAAKMGCHPLIITAGQTGETAAAARLRAGEILINKYAGYDLLLIGGETTPQLPERPGKGGRNQHYAVVSMTALSGYDGEWVLASVGTDGSDFLSDVAGAIVDNGSLSRVEKLGMDVASYLARYDSFNLLKSIGNSLIVTGSTGTNVGDVIVYAFGKARIPGLTRRHL